MELHSNLYLNDWRKKQSRLICLYLYWKRTPTKLAGFIKYLRKQKDMLVKLFLFTCADIFLSGWLPDYITQS